MKFEEIVYFFNFLELFQTTQLFLENFNYNILKTLFSLINNDDTYFFNFYIKLLETLNIFVKQIFKNLVFFWKNLNFI